MRKFHPFYAFPDASITIINKGVVYRLHKTLLQLTSPTFVSSLETNLNASTDREEYFLPQETSIRNDEFEIILNHLYYIQYVRQ